MFGGRDNNRGSFGDMYKLYNDRKGYFRWKEIIKIGLFPEYLSHHTTTVIMDRMYVFGGRLSPM